MEARRFSFRCHANTIYEPTAWLRAEESYQDDILNRPFLACTPAKHLFFFSFSLSFLFSKTVRPPATIVMINLKLEISIS